MTTDWMITAYRPYSERIPSLWKWFSPKEWIVAVEGLQAPKKPHMQIRIKTSKTEKEVKDFIETYGVLLNGVDIRLAEPKDIKDWKYERKECIYRTSWDTTGARESRFGKPNSKQLEFLDRLARQNNRQVTVWYNKDGGAGKSWMCRHLWEKGKCTYIMGTSGSADRIIKDFVSAYNGEDIVVLDLPRTCKWNDEMYEVIEHLKDGLVRDDRYGNRTIDVNGIRVGILCNHMPNQSKLSKDRWDIMET